MLDHCSRWPLCPELAGYWQTWTLPGRTELPLTQVPCGYSDVIIAFAAPDEEGVLHFVGPNVPTAGDVRLLKRRGQRVLLSIGGGGVTVTLDTADKVDRFSESLYQLARALCLSGVDIDVEQGMPATESPDRPEGTALGLIQGLDRVLAALPPGFLLTLAPETANLVGGMFRYGGDWGNYLPLILHFGDRITRVHMQYYNSGTMYGLDGQIHEAGTVDFVVALTEAVIEGFDIADTGVHYGGLPSDKVSIGLPATPEAAGNGYLAPEQVTLALDMLRTGRRGEDRPCANAYPDLGGLMTWSIQWDAQNGYAFMKNGLRNLCLG